MAFSRAWTALRDWTTGELATAAMVNQQLRDNLAYLGPIAYVEFTSNVSITATAEASAQAVVSSGSITYAATPITIEFYAPRLDAATGSHLRLVLQDGATV